MQRVLIIGNSHTQMILSALEQVEFDKNDVEIRVFWLKTRRHGEVEVQDAIKYVEELSPDDVLVVSYLGAFHNQVALFEHDTPLSLTDSHTGVPVPADGTLVPTALLRQAFASRIEGDVLLKQLRAAAKCPVLHYSSPPPRASFRSATKTFNETTVRKFVDPRLRLAAWRIEMDVINAYVSALGIQELAVPVEAVDEGGFLSNSYAARDATHANTAYGALVLRQILDIAGAPHTGARETLQ